MKKFITISLLSVAALISFWYIENQAAPNNNANSSIQSSSTNQEKTGLNTSSIHSTQKAKSLVIPEDHSVPGLIKNAMSQSESEKNAALERVKQWLPELAPRIAEYQRAAQEQAQKVADYQRLNAERNEMIKSGYVPPALQHELEQQKALLLEQAKRLGEQAMEINRAIREQGEAYMASR